mmetsp:Transcript_4824/g.11480  ORF Transcript_4824/g.11480 Transcript_4824/m.11480 type:complete len:215 (-) Transcript_4824:1913-2557(-)
MNISDKSCNKSSLYFQYRTDNEISHTSLKKHLYLLIMSSLSAYEAAHKIRNMKIPLTKKPYVGIVLLESYLHEKTPINYHSDLVSILCVLDTETKLVFEQCFVEVYERVESLSVSKIKMIGNFFSYLFQNNSISWKLFYKIQFTTEKTTSSKRIFLKIVFSQLKQNLGEYFLVKILKILCSKTTMSIFKCKKINDINFINLFFESIGVKITFTY